MSNGYPPGTTQDHIDRELEDEERECPASDCDEMEQHCGHHGEGVASCCLCGALPL